MKHASSFCGRLVVALLSVFVVACAAPPRAGVESPASSSNGAADGGAIASSPALDERARTLVEGALEGEAYAMLRELTATAPARLTGSANAQRAVEWGLATMRRIGLSNVRAEPVMVPHWVRGSAERCELLGDDGATLEDLQILALGGSDATQDGGVEADVIMVRSFEELQQRADEARGRIVFFNRPMPRILASTFRAYGQAVPQRANGAIETGKVGGVFALVRSMTTRIDDNPHTGAMNYAVGVPRVPSAAISTLDAEALAARIARGERVRLRIAIHCATFPDVESANVVGELVGSELPEQIVTVGGHLDSWDVGEGAQDDGAGIVHTLEAARLLRASGMTPRRTIRFVLFMNEENGLRGAHAYRDAHRTEHHHAAFESDAGGDVPLGFGTTARNARFDVLRAAMRALEPWGAAALTPGGGGADIGPLAEHGAELFGLTVISHRYFDYHHSVLDSFESVNERALALGAGVLAYLVSVVADLDLPPRQDLENVAR